MARAAHLAWRDPATARPLAERVILGAFVAAIFLSASWPRLDRVDKLELLGGGQDWLTHESFARDILIGGPLMTLGKPLGEGRTFYAQPFYPYALAAMHALTGEDLFGVVALQVFGSGVAGVQMAEVAVDTETGIVRMVKYVAVQDIGTIVCRKQAKSQVLGAMIMTIAYALSEERIMDSATGRFVNADLEHYKLPRIGDIGELIVEFYEPESQYKKGVVGLGEPPVISGGAAISNAVANAIGKRVPVIPLTPKRVLDTLRA